jgi:hypothetical protein
MKIQRVVDLTLATPKEIITDVIKKQIKCHYTHDPEAA